MPFREQVNDGIARLAAKLARPINSLDWREFHFLKGLTAKYDRQLEMRMCLDFELARESPQIVVYLKRCSNYERQIMLRKPRFNQQYVMVP